MEKVRITLDLAPEVYQSFKVESARAGQTMSAVLRRSIRLFIREQSKRDEFLEAKRSTRAKTGD